jgi:4-alpha-glucanotransferase
MQKTYLIIGAYNHLPEGLSESEFEGVYQSCYRPFLSVLNRFPEIQATLYFSGSLLKRFEFRHPEYLMLLEEMTARRQVELLGGGFYAPIMPLIPSADRLGQIELLTTYLRKTFGKRPRGCWLSEFAWEPWLSSTLQTCGMDYTFLSAEQFSESILDSRFSLLPIITEDQGRCTTILPVHDCSTSFGEPLGFVAGLEQLRPCPLHILMMPGESISSLWESSGLESPDVYMERTFAWLRKNALEYETTTPSRYLKNNRQWSKAYFPGTASRRLIQNSVSHSHSTVGSIRNALLRYAASSALYTRMYYVHLLIGQLRGDKSRKKTAVEDLWKSQCGDAFWITKRGGIRIPSIRQAAYQSLIDAEQTTRTKDTFSPGIIRADMDFDGHKEFLYQGAELNAYVHSRGGAVVELDAIRWRRNLCDVFWPATEGHESRKTMFLDRVYTNQPAAAVALQPWKEDISCFGDQRYENDPSQDSHDSIGLSRDATLIIGAAPRQLGLRKRYTFQNKHVKVAYDLLNPSEHSVDFWFGIEMNFSILPGELDAIKVDGNPVDPAVFYALDGTDHGLLSNLILNGNNTVQTLELKSTVPFNLASATILDSTPFPDIDACVQGCTLLLAWHVQLKPDTGWSGKLDLSVRD